MKQPNRFFLFLLVSLITSPGNTATFGADAHVYDNSAPLPAGISMPPYPSTGNSLTGSSLINFDSDQLAQPNIYGDARASAKVDATGFELKLFAEDFNNAGFIEGYAAGLTAYSVTGASSPYIQGSIFVTGTTSAIPAFSEAYYEVSIWNRSGNLLAFSTVSKEPSSLTTSSIEGCIPDCANDPNAQWIPGTGLSSLDFFIPSNPSGLEWFYVILYGFADGGAIVDLSSTATLSFNLQPGVTVTLDTGQTFVGAIPVPASAWLFGSGLLGLVGIARRKKAT